MNPEKEAKNPRIADILEKMTVFSGGDIHDTEHWLKVWGYAKTIGELEGLDPETQFVLETAAIVHDIACPLCREKYGNANGKLQEKEGPPLVRAFLEGTGMAPEAVTRVAFLVGHHHTYEGVDGSDWQILLEADYIVNASEGGYAPEKIRAFLEGNAKTGSGKRLIREVFRL